MFRCRYWSSRYRDCIYHIFPLSRAILSPAVSSDPPCPPSSPPIPPTDSTLSPRKCYWIRHLPWEPCKTSSSSTKPPTKLRLFNLKPPQRHLILQHLIMKWLQRRYGIRTPRIHPVAFFLSSRWCVLLDAFLPKVSSFRKPTQPAPSLSPVTTFPPNWIRVPQRNYRSKQWNFKRLNPISFSVDGRPGVNMGEALRKACADLDGWDDPVLMDAAGAISCRLLVGLLWFFIRPSTRPLELTAPQVSRLSSQQ